MNSGNNPNKVLYESEDRLLTKSVVVQSIGNEMLDSPIISSLQVKGINKVIIGLIIRIHVVLIAIRIYLNPVKVIKVLKRLDFLRRQYMGNFNVQKLFKVGGRYYWDMHAPGWPSLAFTKYNEGEMNRIIPFRPITDYLNSMILGITKKCPLKCSHCYEWDELNKPETLSLSDLKSIINKFQSRGRGVAQIHFSGGEPLMRYTDILEILKTSHSDTDFWIVTSGYQLTKQTALEFKAKGLCGVAISLDHFIPSKHNFFRGNNDSFKWVLKAIKNAHLADLMVILSLCTTKEFVSKNNLRQYANLAKKLRVSYILLIEPRSVGRYRDMDVALSQNQIEILEDFYIKMNFDKAYSDMPGVSYHGYHQRRIGCFGGGNRYVYINTDGDLQVCPFCQQKYGSALSSNINECANKMKNNGCKPYKQAVL